MESNHCSACALDNKYDEKLVPFFAWTSFREQETRPIKKKKRENTHTSNQQGGFAVAARLGTLAVTYCNAGRGLGADVQSLVQ